MGASGFAARHDTTIRLLIDCGAHSKRIAEATGTTPRFVYRRACLMGLTGAMVRNADAVRVEKRRNRRAHIVRAYHGRRSAAAALPTRVDRVASDLARALQADRAALASLDSPNLIACFHVAGLTLEDIEDRLGVPPVEAVAAIRRAHHGLHP